MAHVLIMPRQGNTVESCLLVAWKVQEGDRVTAETPVCDVETDKATFEIPAGADGTILKLLYPVDEDIPVLTPIAVIGAPGEDWQAALGDAGGAETPASVVRSEEPVKYLAGGAEDDSAPRSDDPPATPAATPASRPVAAAVDGTSSSPRARNLAAQLTLPIESLSGSGPEGRIIERDVRAAAAAQPALTTAARAAVAAGAAPPATGGSGIGGRVTLDDLAAAAAMTPIAADAAGQPVATDQPFPGTFKDTPIKGIRRLIAERMSDSLATTAQFTLNAAADATQLQALRNRFKSAPEAMGLGGVTINDLLLCLVTRLLARHTFMNAHKDGDTLRTFDRVHLGVAVDTERGLMVPVVRNANLMSVKQIAAEVRRLSAACRDGSISPDFLQGSTFTVTNLGALGVESFTPVLNTPEVGILGVGGLTPRPVLDSEGQLVRYAPHIGLSLTINHQVVDGYPAAQFLKVLCDAIADIDLWMML